MYILKSWKAMSLLHRLNALADGHCRYPRLRVVADFTKVGWRPYMGSYATLPVSMYVKSKILQQAPTLSPSRALLVVK